jgi:class 3 adenylate cyclase
LRALRSDLIDPTIAVHHGRIVKRTGDGIIILALWGAKMGVELSASMAQVTILLKCRSGFKPRQCRDPWSWRLGPRQQIVAKSLNAAEQDEEFLDGGFIKLLVLVDVVYGLDQFVDDRG